MRYKTLLSNSLFAGTLYFSAIAVVHMLGFKVPGLYIYFDVPSYEYQDRIISVLAFGWAMFFYVCARNAEMVWYVIISGVVALAGLSYINLSTDFSSLGGNASTSQYWLQTIALFFYVAWLVFCALRNRTQS